MHKISNMASKSTISWMPARTLLNKMSSTWDCLANYYSSRGMLINPLVVGQARCCNAINRYALTPFGKCSCFINYLSSHDGMENKLNIFNTSTRDISIIILLENWNNYYMFKKVNVYTYMYICVCTYTFTDHHSEVCYRLASQFRGIKKNDITLLKQTILFHLGCRQWFD